jgi:putative addiction module antidote
MADRVKVTTIGKSMGIVLPKEVLERLHIERGDMLYITETPGGVQLTPYDPEFARVVKAGRPCHAEISRYVRKLAE